MLLLTHVGEGTEALANSEDEVSITKINAKNKIWTDLNKYFQCLLFSTSPPFLFIFNLLPDEFPI